LRLQFSSFDRATKSPLAVCASAGLSWFLLGFSCLLRRTGHCRHCAMRMVMMEAVMVLANVHNSSRLCGAPANVNSLPAGQPAAALRHSLTKFAPFFRIAQTNRQHPPLRNRKPHLHTYTATCRKGITTMTDYRVQPGQAQEDQLTAAIEKYTAPVPSTVYLGLALASITIQAVQKEKANAALYVGQWVAPFLLLGIYNKMVKQHGSDASTK